MEITINQNENQNVSISNENIQTIGINQNELQTISLSNSNTQDIGVNENENQVILINGGGVAIGITDVLQNGVSVVSGNIAYVIVPTKTSDLINDSGYITTETDPTVPTVVKQITLADINNWNSKQNALVSGTNIKTINNTSLLGSGNIDISGGESYTAGTGIEINNGVINNTITNYNDLTDLPSIPSKTSDLINDENFVSQNDLSEVAFTGSYNSLSDTPVIPDSTSDLTNDSGFIDNTVNNLTNYMLTSDINTALGNKQDTLVSGTNIKTINNNSLLGSGNITISSGTATDVQINGTSIVSNNTANIITESAYNSSTNKIATKNDTLEIYSTNEVLIGKWIDGTNLYRSVINFTSVDTESDLVIDITNLNVKEIVKFDGIMNGIPINFFIDFGGTYYFSSIRYYNNAIYIKCSSVYGNFNGYAILTYTKNV